MANTDWMEGLAVGTFIELEGNVFEIEKHKPLKGLIYLKYIGPAAPAERREVTEAEWNEIAERMGVAGHSAWAEKRRKEKGWHAPEECKAEIREGSLCYTCNYNTGIALQDVRCTKDRVGGCPGTIMSVCDDYSRRMCPNCHTCMRPYKDMPDTEKELPRAYPRLFMSILDEMGYRLERKQPAPGQEFCPTRGKLITDADCKECHDCEPKLPEAIEKIAKGIAIGEARDAVIKEIEKQEAEKAKALETDRQVYEAEKPPEADEKSQEK